MNEVVEAQVLKELVEISADNCTTYNLKKTMKKLKKIIDGEKN